MEERNQINIDLVERIYQDLAQRYEQALVEIVRYGSSKEDASQLLSLLGQYQKALSQWKEHDHRPERDEDQEAPEETAFAA